jgi:hypothetical protein
MTVCPTVSDGNVLVRHKAGLGKALVERSCERAYASADALFRNPITGMAGSCARAARGHAAAPPSIVMNSRRLMSGIGNLPGRFSLPQSR